ncbi:protein YIPF3-like [Oratosquilla oratoria]|uniref:protein YIPF3-like n=1 Tax=Oratosquilla oratoria TaxID=337810 RepID=UPI003F76D5EF
MSHKSHSIVIIESIHSDFESPKDKHAGLFDYWRSVTMFLAPFFSVANHRLPHRIVASLAPPFFFPEFRRVYADLKGPLLILTTLAFVLFYGLYDPDRHVVSDMLTAIKLTFGYWVTFTLFAHFLSYFCQTCLTLLQLLSSVGYSLSGHCLVLLIAEILHQEDSHSVFIFMMTVLGGLATGRFILIVLLRTAGPAQRLVMGSTLACIHIMHLVYLHYACMRKTFQV